MGDDLLLAFERFGRQVVAEINASGGWNRVTVYAGSSSWRAASGSLMYEDRDEEQRGVRREWECSQLDRN